KYRPQHHAANYDVAILSDAPRIVHYVGENEASLLSDDFLRDLGTAFHRGVLHHGSPSFTKRSTSGRSAGRMSRACNSRGHTHARSATSTARGSPATIRHAYTSMTRSNVGYA